MKINYIKTIGFRKIKKHLRQTCMTLLLLLVVIQKENQYFICNYMGISWN